MPAIKGKGFVEPDRTKRYCVVEKPTAGDKKDQITEWYALDLDWDEAQRIKNGLAARRVSRFVTVIEQPPEQQLQQQIDQGAVSYDPGAAAFVDETPNDTPLVIKGRIGVIEGAIAPPSDFDLTDMDASDDAIDRAVREAESIAASEATATKPS